MDSDGETLLLLLLIVLIRRHRCRVKKRKRRYWINPLFRNRHVHSDYITVFNVVKNNNNNFFNYVRMSKPSFYELLSLLESSIQRRDTRFRNSISAEERLLITLRYLGTGCTLSDLQYSFKCGVSTISYIVRDTCKHIYSILKENTITSKSVADWKNIAQGFKINANFPNCLGAIDGKHIRVIKPEHSGSLYFNYKKYFSIVLLAICDANYNFTYIDVGSFGKSADSQIFKNSSISKAITENRLQLPSPEPLCSDGPHLNYTFIGDEAFALTNHMQRPYGGNNLTVKQRIYNYRLSRARRYIECTFGILSNKWRIFHRPLNVSTEFAEEIIRACCVLHNFVRQRDGFNYNHTLSYVFAEDDENIIPSSPTDVHNVAVGGVTTRNLFADYFVSPEGEVPWQNNMI